MTAQRTIIVVSGLPRSGTSMMMKMLESGGMPLVIDHQRPADENNPHGYYEFEKTKYLQHNNAWIDMACGKAIKIISWLLYYLPMNQSYKIIFMHRNIQEILASQQAMIHRLGTSMHSARDDDMEQIFTKHLQEIEHWLNQKTNISVLPIEYRDVLEQPIPIVKTITQFIDTSLNSTNMLSAIIPTLYRQRITTSPNAYED